MSGDVTNFRPIRGREIITHRQTDTESTYCQALLSEQRLQKYMAQLCPPEYTEDEVKIVKIAFFKFVHSKTEGFADISISCDGLSYFKE